MSKQGRDSIAAVVAIAVAVVVWGFSFASTRAVVELVPPITLAFVRFVLAVLILLPLTLRLGKAVHIEKKDRFVLFLGGLSGTTLYFLFENHGLKLIPASQAALIVGSIPVLTVFSEAIVYRRKVGWAAVLAAVISMAGLAMVVGAFSGTVRSSSFPGYLLMLGASMTWVAYNFLTRPLSRKYPMLVLVFWQSVTAVVTLAPLTLFETAAWRPWTLAAWVNILFLGVVCSALAYWAYVFALKRMGESTISFWLNVVPVVAVFAGWVFLGERLSWLQALGGVLVIGAVYMAVLFQRNEERKTSL